MPGWSLSSRMLLQQVQRGSFRAALSHIGKRDLVNDVLELDSAGATNP